MRACILAGGQGTRLRPLTCDVPKPLVPFFHQPVIAWGLEHLAGHGFTHVTATLQYRAADVQRALGDGKRYGVSMTYALEEKPLGTAGGVRAACMGNETLLVYPGDAICDMDLSAALAFHRQRGAAATLLLQRVPAPQSYGVVVCDSTGRVQRFIEKPDAARTLSDAANTGIYLLEPEVLKLIPAGRPYDFARDLFPRMLEEGWKVYGFEAGGYWCDIGDIDTYRAAHRDVLSGTTMFKIPGKRQGDIWLGEGAQVDAGAVISGPVWIGANARVYDGAYLGPYATIGEGSIIESWAHIIDSVLGNNVKAGEGAGIEGAILAKDTCIGKDARVLPGTAIGCGAMVEEGAELMEGVRLWPGFTVARGVRVTHGASTCDRQRPAFGDWGVVARLDGQDAFSWGRAHAKAGGRYGVMGEAAAVSSLIAGYVAGGAIVTPMKPAPLGALRYAVRSLGLDGAAWLYQDRLLFLAEDGIEIDEHQERAMEQRHSLQEAAPDTQGSVEQTLDVWPWYLGYLCAMWQWRGNTVHVYGTGPLTDAACEVLSRAQVRVERHYPLDTQADWAAEGIGFAFGEGGIRFIDEQGKVYGGAQSEGIRTLLAFERGARQVFVPPGWTFLAENLAPYYEARVKRCRPGVAQWQRRTLAAEGGNTAVGVMDDPLQAMVAVLKWMQATGKTMQELCAHIPKIYRYEQVVTCPKDRLAHALGRIATVSPGAVGEEGLRCSDARGRVVLLGSREAPIIRIIAEGWQAEAAEEMAMDWQNQLESALRPDH
nr:sugar phosphate nucleotidyltransferase [bacterium]